MKHTDMDDMSLGMDGTDLSVCYSNVGYIATAGGFDMLTFDTPFEWDGSSNVIVDTAFAKASTWCNCGQTTYDAIDSRGSAYRTDAVDSSYDYDNGSTISVLPRIRVMTESVSAAVDPSSGSWTGNYQVVIRGSNLGNGSDVTNVTLCGIDVASIDSQSATQIVVTAGAAISAGIGDVRVYSVNYGETVGSNAFAYNGPAFRLLGTNGAIIVNGDAPSKAKGSEFPDAFWHYPAVTNIFTITNSGNESLMISSVITNGSTSMAFRVMSCPTNLPAGSSAPCAVALDTDSIGTYTAEVVFASDALDSPFRLHLEGSVEPDIMSIYMPTQEVGGVERNIFSRYDWTVLQALTDLRDIVNQTNEAGIIIRFGGYPGYNPVFTNGNISQLSNDLDYLLDTFPLAGSQTFAMTNNVGDKSFIDQYGTYFTTDEPWLFDPLPFTNTYSVILEAGRHTAAAGILDVLENVELVTRYNRIQILASDNTMTQAVSFAAITNQTYPDTVGLSATASSGLPVIFTNLPGSFGRLAECYFDYFQCNR